ncbi:MAG TPA: restriction endonuclease [Symbiobacteriaceae bacterium]|nr:restriction endonuclease [Symbiobacteriaceae bacterium]
MANWWKIMAGRDGVLFDEFISKKIVSIAGEGLGDVRGKTKEQLLLAGQGVYPDDKPKQIQTWINQLWRFIYEIQPGDRVVVFNKSTRQYSIGTISGAYTYQADMLGPGYSHHFPVVWETNRVSRDSLPESTKNTLGAILAIFQVNNCATDLQAALGGPGTPLTAPPNPVTTPDPAEEENWFENLQGIIQERVADKIVKLGPWQVQDLVAGLLQAMGYRTRTSPPGPDGGVDVLAHPDEFGFGEPLIKVQVKHRRESAGAPQIRELIGAEPLKAKALFVSTGGFTAAARTEARTKNVVILDLDDLVEKIGIYYDRLPSQTQAILPMQRLYLPL